MVKKDKITRNGVTKTYIRVVEGYRPEPKASPKFRTIKSFGYLEEQPNPEEFLKMVEEFDREYFENKPPITIVIDWNNLNNSEENRKQNYGYKFLEAVYEKLEIGKFVEEYEKGIDFKGKYSIDKILRFLVYQRMLVPASKRRTVQLKNTLYGMELNFTLEDVYRALDHIANMSEELQVHLNEKIKDILGRDLSELIYDVTNFYFEIDFPKGENDPGRRGVSKEHRVDPIIGMGMFLDEKALPVSMKLFEGNRSDSLTLEPMMKELKERFGLKRVIVVADKGINSNKNIEMLINNGDGYVFSQVLRGKKGKRYHEKLFDEKGWVWSKDGSYKYKLFEEEYEIKKVKRKRKVLIYWSKEQEEYEKKKRKEKIEKTKKMLLNNAYGIKKGIEEYALEEIMDLETGEILEDIKKVRKLNTKKIAEDEKYDGYFCLVTSELECDERKLREIYSRLWKIEETFKVMKSDLYTRPVFVWKPEHIKAHFVICFVALLIVRLIQQKMGEPISVEKLSRVLNAAKCEVLRGGIVHLHEVGGMISFEEGSLKFTDKDEESMNYQKLQKAFGVKINRAYLRKEEFNKLLKSIEF